MSKKITCPRCKGTHFSKEQEEKGGNIILRCDMIKRDWKMDIGKSPFRSLYYQNIDYPALRGHGVNREKLRRIFSLEATTTGRLSIAYSLGMSFTGNGD